MGAKGSRGGADGARVFTLKKQQFLNYPFKFIFERVPPEMREGVRRR